MKNKETETNNRNEHGFFKGYASGFAYGYRDVKAKIINQMYRNGLSLEEIEKYSDMSLEDIKLIIEDERKYVSSILEDFEQESEETD